VRQPPNMVTNPCKKGTYGVFGTYLGYKKVTRRRPPPAASCDVTEWQGYKGASGEFECAPKPEFVARNPRQHPPAGTYLTRYASLSASARQLQTRPRRSSRRPPAPARLAKLSEFGSTGAVVRACKAAARDGACRYVPLGPRPATARKAGGDDKAPFNPGGCELLWHGAVESRIVAHAWQPRLSRC
jgi:hypothetical protein